MIGIAYDKGSLFNLDVLRGAKQLYKHDFISEEQFLNVEGAYKSSFYSPHFVIRILLFIASLLVLAGVTGLLALMTLSSNETVIGVACIIYGLAAYFILELVMIKNNNHFKSGVTEALLYHSIGFIICGFGLLSDFNNHLLLIIAILLLAFSAIRYLDLLCTIASLVCFAWFLFLTLYDLEGLFRHIIPFVFMAVFYGIYFITRTLDKNLNLYFWRHNITIIKVFCLIVGYAGGNYLVVRELSVSMMNLNLAEGEHIPFHYMFYLFTVLIPAMYLYFGIRTKDVVLLRVSLVLIAFAAFTIKYYNNFGHPEITLTLAGAIVLILAIALLNYLKIMRGGYTRDNIFTEKWSSLNVEAFVISQTVGGNQIEVTNQDTPGGGSFGGGGSTDSF